MRAEIEQLTLRLRAPLTTSYGEVAERELLLLRIEDRRGRVAWGEAAALEPYDGVSTERCRAALEAHAEVLRRGIARGGAALLDACRDADPLPQALAAVDVALWDLAGQRELRPIADLLAGRPSARVPVGSVIAAASPDTAAASARDAAGAGFGCVKLKVGTGDDASRVAAVRDAVGPRVALRLDANGAWTVEQAVAAIDSLARFEPELVEEPVHGVAALREVRERSTVQIAMDETAAEPGAIGSGATDAVCLKLGRAGGISALLAQASLARAAGATIYLASTLDGPIGIAAAIHCAAALNVSTPCGLATLGLFEDIDAGPLEPRSGTITVPQAPGLGIAPPRG